MYPLEWLKSSRDEWVSHRFDPRRNRPPLTAVALSCKQATEKGYSPSQANAVTVTNHGLQESLAGQLFDVVMVRI